MAIYEYECSSCGVIEIEHKISDSAKSCPTCGTEIKRIISRSSFHLKGDGWYKTDYAKPGKKPKSDES